MNKIALIGNLTADPELRTTPSGINVCNFSLAVNCRSKKESGPDVKNNVQYFHITVWRTLAENCKKYLTKGRKVFVAGPLSARSYTAGDGTTRFILDVTAEDIEFLSGNPIHSESTPAINKDDSSDFIPVQMTPEELPF